jgi:hypothetical protein
MAPLPINSLRAPKGRKSSKHRSNPRSRVRGREQAVLRAIDYSVGSTGAEIHGATHIDTEELADILNGLCEVGYVEVFPHAERVNAATCATSRFEVNPSYALDLKAALRRS